MKKQEVLKVAVKLAKERGLINLSRADISQAAGIPDGSWTAIVGASFLDVVGEVKAIIGEEKYFPVTKKRVLPELRKENILSCALKLSESIGYTNVKASDLAEMAGVTSPNIFRHFGTITQLRRDIMRKAVKSKNLKVIAQGLAAGDSHAQKADPELKAEALKCLI